MKKENVEQQLITEGYNGDFKKLLGVPSIQLCPKQLPLLILYTCFHVSSLGFSSYTGRISSTPNTFINVPKLSLTTPFESPSFSLFFYSFIYQLYFWTDWVSISQHQLSLTHNSLHQVYLNPFHHVDNGLVP